MTEPKKKNLQPFQGFTSSLNPQTSGLRSDFKLQQNKIPEVVFIGDSIVRFWNDMHPDFFLFNNFSARGVPGETSSEILERFSADATDSGANISVLICGANDLAELGNEPDFAQRIMQNIHSMANEAICIGHKLILCSLTPAQIIPWAPQIDLLTQKIEQLNNILRSFAEQRHFPFANFYAQMITTDGQPQPQLTVDGLHPSSRGYSIMERVIIKSIEKLTLRKDSYFVTP